jgi:hypothetical protein
MTYPTKCKSLLQTLMSSLFNTLIYPTKCNSLLQFGLVVRGRTVSKTFISKGFFINVLPTISHSNESLFNIHQCVLYIIK